MQLLGLNNYLYRSTQLLEYEKKNAHFIEGKYLNEWVNFIYFAGFFISLGKIYSSRLDERLIHLMWLKMIDVDDYLKSQDWYNIELLPKL